MSTTPTPPEGGKLLPCPFCGGEADVCETGVVWFRCENCEAESGARDTLREAIATWNTRADQWQPIDDFAREIGGAGTVLIVANGFVGEAGYFAEEDGWWWEGSHPNDYPSRRAPEPVSAWQPLPAPPRAAP